MKISKLQIIPFNRDLWRRRRLVRWCVFGIGFVLLVFLCLQIALRVLPVDYDRLMNEDVSSVITDRNGKFLRAYLSRDDRWRLPASIDSIPAHFIQATLATEDKRYHEHNGIDWLAVGRAAIANVHSRRVVSGASTITMQVAGFLIDSRDRSLSRKLKQAFVALQLEHKLTKRQILECYLTHASYGGNICGVEAASRRYFNKTAAHLSPGESTLLAGIPQSPERFRPDRHLARSLKRRDYVLNRMLESNALNKSDVERITKLPLHVGTYGVPMKAAHFCDAIRSSYPGDALVRTSLDNKLQTEVEKTFSAFAAQNRKVGITNGSIVVLHNRTGEIRALVGATDYWSTFDDGQVNGALAFRSPGSILKPLFYATALDEGQLSPRETLFDVPTFIGGYAPQNYDRQFRGPVSAEKALAWSLNIPAITVLHRVGVARFQDLLASVNIPMKINKFGDPGLSLAIGTCSVKLIDMVRAYASLATEGVMRDIAWKPVDTQIRRSGRWVKDNAALSVLAALANNDIRAPEEIVPSLSGIDRIAWKTGTSNGFRDAWTIAVTEDYTVGVWVGNMDGSPSRGLVGSKAAAPAALTIAATLRGQNAKWPEMPGIFQDVELCTVSGVPANQHCVQRQTGQKLQDVPVQSCRIHEVVDIDPVTRFCLCTRCSSKGEIEKAVCINLPAAASSWLRVNAHPWSSALKAPHNPNCEVASQGEPPAITSPSPGAQIVLLDALPASQQMVRFSAVTDDPNERLYWFMNGNLVGTAYATQGVRVLPHPGRHRIVCTDARGRSSESWFVVEESDRIQKGEQFARLKASAP